MGETYLSIKLLHIFVAVVALELAAVPGSDAKTQTLSCAP